MALLDTQNWRQFIQGHPEAHILQTLEWAKLKAGFGWTPKFVQKGQIGVLVLFKPLPLGLSVAYIPRGPIGDGDWSGLWEQVDELCRQEHAVFLRVEPDIWEPVEEEVIQKQLPGFLAVDQTIQPPRTILIDLKASEEDILMRMKSKTRYNIRLAGRKDIEIKSSTDVDAFHHMMLTTGERDEFGIHSREYYQKAFDLFSPKEACTLLIAEYEGQPLAGLMAFAHGETAWYFYGASTNQERNRMPTYLLQWEAMRWAKSRGCKVYDMWGAPDFPEPYLEDNFLDRSDGLWGVYRFKRGFGGEVRRTIGAWDRIYRPFFYNIYKFLAGWRRTPSA
ncbi:MAG: peptidoglycan bridge formation glycyltransferase FemA/FemB family protein [Chloroflexota bacterium]|jgi:lipid II:glycine glycyltransferase (peptidoglycan interpeptide bridge formation enzyme)|nr:peptidoglycan bridge formation glycyltransferase FemA/FemB family protein [Chloroflexota bacterium]